MTAPPVVLVVVAFCNNELTGRAIALSGSATG